MLEILTPIWHLKAVMARCVQQRMRAVLEWAVAMEFRLDNPCDRVVAVLGAQHDVVQHMRALPHREVPVVIKTVRASNARPVVKLAFEFLVLTAARSGEVRGAVWTEIGSGRGCVGDSRHANEGEAGAAGAAVPPRHRDSGRGPGRSAKAAARCCSRACSKEKQLSDMILSGLLKDLKIAAVPHGFRSSFRDWAAEETNHPREVIEAALAHVVRNKVEAAYARSDLFERRRILMDDWAAYLGQGIAKDSEP